MDQRIINSRRQFAKWLKKRDPFMYRLAIKRHQLSSGKKIRQKGLSGYDVDEGMSGVWDSIADTIKQIAPTIAQYPYQKKMLNLQLKRAEQGLPPIDTAQYAPAIKIAPQITPESEAAITRMAKDTLGAGLKKFIVPLVLVGGGLFLYLRKKRR